MEFEISHHTSYTYTQPAAEAYGEARLAPPNLPTQTVIDRKLVIEPATIASPYTDYYGNHVEFFALPFRHKALTISNHVVVRTAPPQYSTECLGLSVQEARQIFTSTHTDVFHYLQPTDVVEIGREATQWARRYLRGDTPVGEGLAALNEAIFRTFEYKKGSTDNSTALSTIWKQRKGVCQDFAHVLLSIVRTAGLPARYVCGYIESESPTTATGRSASRLRGAVATHAWVDVLVPGMAWIALDPTNNQYCGERYVAVSYGRDFRDATPLRGTFKGSGQQVMKVKVLMKRRSKTSS